ncbi:MAG: Uma2 family endonuclease [Leptolyngbyaceae cyanobacterium CRU_2_3]|nr:Uma2 family endonuclease [Leptolyngbyaceae cyanobacterium CRU_2_3]
MTQQRLNSEELVTELDISHIVIEDDTPVDNFQSEKQQRLLVEPLYSSWLPSVPFIAGANVGLFYGLKLDPIVPDAFLSLNVKMPDDWSQKQNRSYFVWEFGKLPEVAIEIVSNRKGHETDSKKADYARIGVAYYVVFDPLKQIQGKDELNGSLMKVWELTGKQYVEVPEPFWLEFVGLGLKLWEGIFEDQAGVWLRWCDRNGQVIPTGGEGREIERQRTEIERQGREIERQRAEEAELRAKRLTERLREMGINPDEI